MDYRTAAEFFPAFSPQDQVLAFSILGGIPHYLAQFDDHLSVADNIKRHALAKGCALYSEVEFLLHQELRETSVYNGIIQAVALGASSLGEIASRAMVDAQKAAVYLRNLIELGIIEREFSVEASIKEQSKGARGLYRMADEFFRFWYAFVFPNRSDLEMLDVDGVYRFDVEPQLTRFASASFEDICRTWLLKQEPRGRTSYALRRNPGALEQQLEIVPWAFRRPTARKTLKLFGECKFGHELVEAFLRILTIRSRRSRQTARASYLFAREESFRGPRTARPGSRQPASRQRR